VRHRIAIDIFNKTDRGVTAHALQFIAPLHWNEECNNCVLCSKIYNIIYHGRTGAWRHRPRLHSIAWQKKAGRLCDEVTASIIIVCPYVCL